MIELNKIYCENNLETMARMPDNFVDLVIADPPYGIDYQSARRTDRAKWKPKIANDTAPFIEWIEEAYRVTKDGGCVVCFHRWDVAVEFAQEIERVGYTVKSQVIWDKEIHGMGDLNSEFAPQHENAWFGIKGRFKFKRQRPKTVIRVQRVFADKMIHPNEKPIGLYTKLIYALTTEGDIVYDPFVGSGNSIIACHKVGVNYIGSEISQEYVEMANKRLQPYLAQERLAI